MSKVILKGKEYLGGVNNASEVHCAAVMGKSDVQGALDTIEDKIGDTEIPATLGDSVTGAISSLNSTIDKYTNYNSVNIVRNSSYTASDNCNVSVFSRHQDGFIKVEISINNTVVWGGYIYAKTSGGGQSPYIPLKAGQIISFTTESATLDSGFFVVNG